MQLPSWILSAIVAFILRELAGWGDSTNWASVAASIKATIDAKLPSFLQGSANAGVDQLIGIFVVALNDSADLALIVGNIVTGNMAGALAALEALVMKVVVPQAQEAAKADLLCALKELQAAHK